jgi:hypothetical protein
MNEIHSMVIDVNEGECIEAELLGFEYVTCHSNNDIRVNYVQFVVRPSELSRVANPRVMFDCYLYVGWIIGDITFIDSETTKVLNVDEYDDNVTLSFKTGLEFGVRDEFMPIDDDDVTVQ